MKSYDDLDNFEKIIVGLECSAIMRKTRKELHKVIKKFDLDRKETENTFIIALLQVCEECPDDEFEEE